MKICHRGTEDVIFSLAGSPAFQWDRPLARKKSLRLRRIFHVVLQNCYGFEKLISRFRNVCLCEAESETTYLEGILVG